MAMRWGWLLAAAALATGPALAGGAGADVKAGVDAWARGDFKAAVEQWRGPAIAGDPDAQFNLGQAYKLGRGVPVDPGLAQSWFHKAALQGHEQASDNYALALFQGGRKEEALPWLQHSAARGEPRCQLVLGTMLFNGDGVPRDYPRAFALMTRAAAAGLPSASETLAQMDQYITPQDRRKGTELAQRYATDAAARPAPAPGPRTAAPPPVEAAPAPSAGLPPRPRPEPVRPGPTARPAVDAAVPVPLAPGAGRPVPTAGGGGGWAAQLGAFRDRGHAEALWERTKARLPGARPIYAEANGLIRLRAGGYATRAEAQAACARAGLACILVAP